MRNAATFPAQVLHTQIRTVLDKNSLNTTLSWEYLQVEFRKSDKCSIILRISEFWHFLQIFKILVASSFRGHEKCLNFSACALTHRSMQRWTEKAETLRMLTRGIHKSQETSTFFRWAIFHLKVFIQMMRSAATFFLPRFSYTDPHSARQKMSRNFACLLLISEISQIGKKS